MRKSGLQKQISSIFNDVPAPQAEVTDLELPESELSEQKSAAPNLPQAAPSIPKQPSEPKPQSVPSIPRKTDIPQQAAIAEPPVQAAAPAVTAMRPKPLRRVQAADAKPKVGPSIGEQLKKAMGGGSNGKIDARQKKMAVLVGLLSVVFAGVLYVSLGGVGQKKTTPAKPGNETSTAQPAKTVTAQKWDIPEPLPDNLRDPIQTVVVKADPIDPVENAVDGGQGQVTVTGIVFGEEKCSAIVDGKIVHQGDTVNGIQIVTINRDSVEFEQNGKRWTQQVRQ